MKILISPAKSLDYESKVPTEQHSNPFFLDKAVKLNKSLRQKNPFELQELMGISEKLANINWSRNQSFCTPFNKSNSRQAVFAFNGDVYSGLDAYNIKDYGQDKLRILSGLYGILKPLDLIQPYRLEMGTKFGIEGHKTLYSFWKDDLTKFLKTELIDSEIVVNLASKEYSDAINFNLLESNVITPIFKDFKNEKYKIISFYAKKARGLMSKYLIENKSNSLNDILAFNASGYSYSESETFDSNQPVFVR